MTIELKDVDQVWQNETTRYWFNVDGLDYCIADQNGELSLLDCYGYPIEECNDHEKIKEKIMDEYADTIGAQQ